MCIFNTLLNVGSSRTQTAVSAPMRDGPHTYTTAQRVLIASRAKQHLEVSLFELVASALPGGAFVLHHGEHAVGVETGAGGKIIISDDSYDFCYSVSLDCLRLLLDEFHDKDAQDPTVWFRLVSGPYDPQPYDPEFYASAGMGKYGREAAHRCSVCGQTGHRKDGPCPKKRPSSSRRPRRKIDKATQYSTHCRPKTVTLRTLSQIPYPELVAFTEAKSKRYLRSLGLLPPRNLTQRTCFHCGGEVKPEGARGFRCKDRSCNRALRRADLAFTPLWHLQKGGHLRYGDYLRALYLYGLKIPQDAFRHLLGVGEDAACNLYGMIRVAVAFAELHAGRDQVFDDGTLEMDGTKTNINRASSASTNRHCGRFLVVIHRETGKYALEPLDDKDVKKGAPPPPETTDEAAPLVRHAVHDGHVVPRSGICLTI
jgi:hypothetical protein